MRSVLAALLIVEAIVIGLAIPAAIALSDVSGAEAGIGGGAAALLCLVTAFTVRRRAGVIAGSVLQVGVFALGVVVPVMFILGGVFGALWVGSLVAERRLRQIAASRTT